MANVIHMLIINQYFDKYRASALGLAYSGDCFGTFAFPVILEHLLETYNIQGTFLILSGILLNIVPMAMLLKKPPWHRKSETEVAKKEHQNNSDEIARRSVGYRNESFLKFDEDLSPFQTLADDYCTYNAAYGPLRLTDVHKNSLSVWRGSASSISGSIATHRKTSGTSTHRNDSLIPVYEKELVIDPLETSDVSLHNQLREDHEELRNTTLDSRHHQEDNVTKRRSSSSVSQIALEILHKVRSASFASQVAQDGFISNLSRTASEMNLEPTPRKKLSKDSLKNGSSSDIQIYSINTEKEHILSTGKSTSDDLKSGPLTDNVFFHKNGGPQHELSQNQPSSDDSNNGPASGTVIFSRKGGNEIIMTVQEIQLSDPNYLALSQQGLTPFQTKPPSILKLLIQTNLKPIFFLISMTMAVFAYCFIGVGIILIDYAGDQGIPHHQAKFLVIGFSVTDLIGRLVFGQVIDRNLVKMKNYVSVILLVMGILVACLPLNASFSYMMAFMCLFGASVGGAAIMYPILVNQYMDKGEESVAMGSLNFYGGILALSMAPMIGKINLCQLFPIGGAWTQGS